MPNVEIVLSESVTPEIAAFIHFENSTLNEISPCSLIIKTQQGKNTSIPTTSTLWEPLSYLLLFPHGTRGWGCNSGEYEIIFL